jgi:hypothetical protein
LRAEPLAQEPPLPVTAKLSRRFYEQFGDEVTNELVNWFNAVDETYRSQLRELNELNWERFRSELRAEGASIRAEMDRRFAAVDLRFGAVDARFDGVDTRLDGIDASLASMKQEFPAMEERIETKLDAKFETRMYRRMFVFWTATTIPLAVLIVALSGAFQR